MEERSERQYEYVFSNMGSLVGRKIGSGISFPEPVTVTVHAATYAEARAKIPDDDMQCVSGVFDYTFNNAHQFEPGAEGSKELVVWDTGLAAAVRQVQEVHRLHGLRCVQFGEGSPEREARERIEEQGRKTEAEFQASMKRYAEAQEILKGYDQDMKDALYGALLQEDNVRRWNELSHGAGVPEGWVEFVPDFYHPYHQPVVGRPASPFPWEFTSPVGRQRNGNPTPVGFAPSPQETFQLGQAPDAVGAAHASARYEEEIRALHAAQKAREDARKRKRGVFRDALLGAVYTVADVLETFGSLGELLESDQQSLVQAARGGLNGFDGVDPFQATADLRRDFPDLTSGERPQYPTQPPAETLRTPAPDEVPATAPRDVAEVMPGEGF